jgi:hypothetical protein
MKISTRINKLTWSWLDGFDSSNKAGQEVSLSDLLEEGVIQQLRRRRSLFRLSGNETEYVLLHKLQAATSD